MAGTTATLTLVSSQSLHWQRAHSSALATWLDKGPVRNGALSGALATLRCWQHTYPVSDTGTLPRVPIATALKRWRSIWSSRVQHTTRLGGRREIERERGRQREWPVLWSTMTASLPTHNKNCISSNYSLHKSIHNYNTRTAGLSKSQIDSSMSSSREISLPNSYTGTYQSQ